MTIPLSWSSLRVSRHAAMAHNPADVETALKPVPLILLVDDDEITRIGTADD